MSSEKESLASVLAYLKRHGFKGTEEILKKEAGDELIHAIEDGDFVSERESYYNNVGDEPTENETVIHNINKAKVYYGLPKEPDINIPPDFEFSDDDDGSEGEEDRERPTKKRKISKKDFFARRFKSDPNAPSKGIPFPPLSELEKIDKLNGWKDAMKAARLGESKK